MYFEYMYQVSVQLSNYTKVAVYSIKIYHEFMYFIERS